MAKKSDRNSTLSNDKDNRLPLMHTSVQGSQSTPIGRKHVESEESLNSVLDFPKQDFQVENFITGKHGIAQILSADEATGESTQRVHLSKGWTAPIGHFTENIEIFVLKGRVKQGGFPLRDLSYSFIPAGVPTGPWVAEENTVLLWMPDATPTYVTDPYADLPQIGESSVYHPLAQTASAVRDYIPIKEIRSMPWESTRYDYLPPGAARRSLRTNTETGRDTWILGLVPMFIEGNFLGGHPTTEEAYMLTGNLHGHWPMNDDPFNRRYWEMKQDGYFWRPAHVPHGPFWTDTGSLLLFRTKGVLGYNWMLHNSDIGQQNFQK
ncbi:MAG: DUF4437 domain-containing protein [Calothrix sp. MO_192.B10]|nr:DUF4437 domain-containing protein [Calothrix sp. MO_192.B10]